MLGKRASYDQPRLFLLGRPFSYLKFVCYILWLSKPRVTEA